MKTFSAKSDQIKRRWVLVNASGKILGRLATEIAKHLRGKYKCEYTPNIDTGDYVIVINANKVCITGNKYKSKIYQYHTGYIGGIKSTPFNKLIKKNPARIIERAVKGMLPKNSLGNIIYRKLKVYAGENHPHIAQQPQILNI